MSDTPPPPESGGRRRFWDRVSVVWLIPVAALVIAGVVAWQSWADRGPLIEIAFDNASGISANETELRYRDVKVGTVEDVGFSDSLDKVLVGVRLDKEVAGYVDEGAEFWVVRPQVSTRGVSGLNTVLSGVYIEGLWDTDPGKRRREFVGLADAPLVRPGQDGLRLTMRSAGGDGFTEETPIFYRGVEVGRIGTSRISDDGSAAVADAVIYTPHSDLISSQTRFWDISGFTFSLGAGGATVDFTSLASLLTGGIAFETPVSGGGEVTDGDSFQVYADRETALSSVEDVPEGEGVDVAAIFSENVTGLEVGAPVELRGVRIGEVRQFSGVLDPDRFGDSRMRLRTVLSLQPGLLGLPEDAGTPETLDYLAERVQAGLRARLASASLLTGGLRVELVQVEDAGDAGLDRDAEPYPILPTTASDITDVRATAKTTLERVQNLPIEEVMASTVAFLDSATRLVSSDDLQQTPGEVRGLLADARGVIGSDEVQALPGEVSGLVSELDGATRDLRAVLARLEEARVVDRLLGAVAAAEGAARSADTALAGVPKLIDRLDAVAARAESLPIEDLVTQLTEILDSADTLIARDGTQQLPAALTSALGEIETVLEELREGGTVKNANEALAAARRAAGSVADAADGLPGAVDRIDRVLAQAQGTLSDYDADSEVTRQIRSALREVQRAAASVSSLARTIERDPNSLLLGR